MAPEQGLHHVLVEEPVHGEAHEARAELRVRRGVDLDPVHLRELPAQEAGQGADAGLDPLAADGLLEVEGGLHGQHERPGALAQAVVAGRPALLVVPARGHHGRPEALLGGAAQVEEARAGGGVQPLVGAHCVEVHPQVVHVELQHAQGVGAVHHGQDALGARERGQLLDREPAARLVGEVADADDSGAGGDGPGEDVDEGRGVGARDGERQLLQHHPVALGLELPGVEASRVLVEAQQDLVARLEVEAVGHEAHALGGVAGEGDLVGLARPRRPRRRLRTSSAASSCGLLRPPGSAANSRYRSTTV